MAESSRPDALRLLVVDNERQPHDLVENRIDAAGLTNEIVVYHAYDGQEARRVFDEHYLDYILLDLYFADKTLGGTEVLQDLARNASAAEVIVMTKGIADRDIDRVMQASSRLPNRPVVNYLKKSELFSVLPGLLSDLHVKFRARAVKLLGLDEAVSLIEHRRDRYPRNPRGGPRLRSDPTEICVEVERICRELFGRTSTSNRTTTVSVGLERLDRRGLSAAVTIKPVVRLSINGITSQSAKGYECVLKLGPVADIKEEVARYEEYVRYGVQLEQRVELLSSDFREAIGGVVYSFAGGVYGQELVTLDELLRRPSPGSALEVVNDLFDSVYWYSLEAASEPISNYMNKTFKVGLEPALLQNERSLINLAQKHHELLRVDRVEDRELRIHVAGGPNLTIPGPRFLGEGWSLESFPCCLVHGDMHGGNVMAELSPLPLPGGEEEAVTIERVCLIDYRNAGPGPRCIDAAALEASVRIADAEEIAGLQEDSTRARDLSGDALADAMATAARRLDNERQLYHHLWGRRGSIAPAPWSTVSGAIVNRLRTTFSDDIRTTEVGSLEYLQTVILYAIRQLSYAADPITRIRICAWLAANYAAFKKELKAAAQSAPTGIPVAPKT